MHHHQIAIVGCGGIALHRHIPGYQEVLGDRVRVTAAVDPDPDQLAKADEMYGIEKRYTGIEPLLDDEAIDIVTITTPPGVRSGVILPLIDAGKHLLVEKPFTWRLPESVRIVRQAEAAGVRLAVSQNFRYKRVAQKMKQIVDSGELGDLRYLDQNYYIWRESGGWRAEIDQLEISMMSVHWLDRLRWLCGRRAEAVYAALNDNPAQPAVGETLSCTTITFGDGVIAHCNSGWYSRIQLIQSRIDGTRGSLVAYDDVEVQVVSEDRPDGARYRFDDEDFVPTYSFGRSMEALVDAIDAGEEPPHSGRDNLMTMEIVDAAYRAAEHRETVPIGGESL